MKPTNSRDLNEYGIPYYTMESIDKYVNCGVCGDFVRAVMENNLMEALGRADSENRAAIFEICLYVHNRIPDMCHGSAEKVKAWGKTKLKKRMQKEARDEHP